MWDLPRPGLEPMSPALAGRFLTTVPPGKPRAFIISDLDNRLLTDLSPYFSLASLFYTDAD